jgi:signal transduction histidine kinase
MRVATKLTLALGALGFLLFGGYGLRQAQHEAHLLRRIVEQEVDVLSRSLEVAMEHALRDRQPADIADTLSRLEGISPHVDIVVYDERGQVRAASAGSPTDRELDATLAAAAQREGQPQLRDSADGSRLALARPLEDGRGHPAGAVVLGYPLESLHQEIRDARRDVALVVLGFVGLTAVTGLLLGTVHVGRPLQRLVAAMRRVQAGDLAADLPAARRSDEVGELTTAFNEMTHELRAARQRVSDEVERTHALEARLARADKLIAVGQLAATLAHEIGSPLQVLVGRARALATRDYPAERVSRHATIIADQAERIAGIVEGLLSYARQRPGHAEPTALPEAAASVVELLQGEAKRRGVAVSSAADPRLPDVVCDGARFQQVVFNLLHNALEASSKGSTVEISFRAEKREDGTMEGIRMTIVDEGVGIASEDLPHVFEPFFTTRVEGGGTGLGLVVARSIVRDDGGTIAIDSELGRGTRVTVRYPVET